MLHWAKEFKWLFCIVFLAPRYIHRSCLGGNMVSSLLRKCPYCFQKTLNQSTLTPAGNESPFQSTSMPALFVLFWCLSVSLVWDYIWLLFWCASSWWLVVWRNFSYVFWTLVFLLYRSFYLSLLVFIGLDKKLFCKVQPVSYASLLLTTYQMCVE